MASFHSILTSSSRELESRIPTPRQLSSAACRFVSRIGSHLKPFIEWHCRYLIFSLHALPRSSLITLDGARSLFYLTLECLRVSRWPFFALISILTKGIYIKQPSLPGLSRLRSTRIWLMLPPPRPRFLLSLCSFSFSISHTPRSLSHTPWRSCLSKFVPKGSQLWYAQRFAYPILEMSTNHIRESELDHDGNHRF